MAERRRLRRGRLRPLQRTSPGPVDRRCRPPTSCGGSTRRDRACSRPPGALADRGRSATTPAWGWVYMTLHGHYLDHLAVIEPWADALRARQADGDPFADDPRAGRPRRASRPRTRPSPPSSTRSSDAVPAERWDAAEVTPGWTLRDHVGHLADWAAEGVRAIEVFRRRGHWLADPEEGLDAWNERHVAAARGESAAATLARYDATRADLHAAIASLVHRGPALARRLVVGVRLPARTHAASTSPWSGRGAPRSAGRKADDRCGDDRLADGALGGVRADHRSASSRSTRRANSGSTRATDRRLHRGGGRRPAAVHRLGPRRRRRPGPAHRVGEGGQRPAVVARRASPRVRPRRRDLGRRGGRRRDSPASSPSRAAGRDPRWSPDGHRLGFLSRRRGWSQVWLIDAPVPRRGRPQRDPRPPEATPLTQAGVDVEAFAWSPDGDAGRRHAPSRPSTGSRPRRSRSSTSRAASRSSWPATRATTPAPAGCPTARSLYVSDASGWFQVVRLHARRSRPDRPDRRRARARRTVRRRTATPHCPRRTAAGSSTSRSTTASSTSSSVGSTTARRPSADGAGRRRRRGPWPSPARRAPADLAVGRGLAGGRLAPRRRLGRGHRRERDPTPGPVAAARARRRAGGSPRRAS